MSAYNVAVLPVAVDEPFKSNMQHYAEYVTPHCQNHWNYRIGKNRVQPKLLIPKQELTSRLKAVYAASEKCFAEVSNTKAHPSGSQFLLHSTCLLRPSPSAFYKSSLSFAAPIGSSAASFIARQVPRPFDTRASFAFSMLCFLLWANTSSG